MNNLIITIGISGSGKSTWAINLLKNSSNYIRCNRDDIRRTLIGDLSNYYGRRDLKGFEKTVTSIEHFILKTAIERNKSIIVDNTNLKINTKNNIVKHFDTNRYNIYFKLFDCDLETAQNRVLLRDYNGKNIKGDTVAYIEKQYQHYQSVREWVLNNCKENII